MGVVRKLISPINNVISYQADFIDFNGDRCRVCFQKKDQAYKHIELYEQKSNESDILLMGIKVREKDINSGCYYVFVNYNGRRKSLKVGNKDEAEFIAIMIRKRLLCGEFNIMSHIYKRGKQWWIKYYIGGEPYRRSLGTYDNDLAIKRANKIDDELNRAKQHSLRYSLLKPIEYKKCVKSICKSTGISELDITPRMIMLEQERQMMSGLLEKVWSFKKTKKEMKNGVTRTRNHRTQANEQATYGG